MQIRDFSALVSSRGKSGQFPSEAKDPRIGTEEAREPDYEASEGVSECLQAIRSQAPVILISGRAGTGKSRLIRYLGRIPEGRRQIVVAPTGVAALNLGCQTIHSSFRLPFGAIDAARMESARLRREIQKIDRLVIDEISMVRADIIDAIDRRLREFRANEKPFGGVQVVMVGDFLQLPPVTKPDQEAVLKELGYQTPYAFSAKVLQDIPLTAVTLRKVWRQSDPEMIEMLGNIRQGRRISDAVDWFNARCHRSPRDGSRPLLLTPTRAAADRYNQAGLRAAREMLKKQGRDGEEHLFEAQRTGSFEKTDASQLPVPDRQTLLPGVRVMAVRNDPGGSFVNGSLGDVLEILPDEKDPKQTAVKVLFDGAKEPAEVRPMAWEDLRQSWNASSGCIDRSVAGRYVQIPLALGYASTIHKGQGMTLEDVRLDLGTGAFAPGQLYVALSRAKSAEGLSMARPIQPRDVRVDEMLRAFLEWANSAGNLKVTLTGS